MMPVWGLASLVVAVAVLCAVVELKLEEATESPVDERKEKERTIETKAHSLLCVSSGGTGSDGWRTVTASSQCF
ncbi:UNVERIFIED_CONTAM: hypothetical protein K2H54_054026 [Gekko kuhli]